MNERLREALEYLAWESSESFAEAIARAVCESLEITREMVEALEMCMAAPQYRTADERRAIAVLTALLDLGGVER